MAKKTSSSKTSKSLNVKVSKLSASQIVALIGSIFLIVEGIQAILSLSVIGIIGGILGIILGILLLATIGLIKIKWFIPNEWWIYLIFGILALVVVWTASYTSGVVILIAALLKFLKF